MLELFSMSVMRSSDIAIRLDGYIQYSRISADTLTSLRRFGLEYRLSLTHFALPNITLCLRLGGSGATASGIPAGHVVLLRDKGGKVTWELESDTPYLRIEWIMEDVGARLYGGKVD